MNFNMAEAIEVLERTPQTLENFLSGLSEGWLQCNEGEGKPFPRSIAILICMTSMSSMEQKLLESKIIRAQKIAKLKELIKTEGLELTGFHPAFGVVKIRELIAAWAVHDLAHMGQIVRVMAKRKSSDEGRRTPLFCC